METTLRPRIVCLCGSTRFLEVFEQANKQETCNGHIVLTVGIDFKREGAQMTPDDKARLDRLHLAKIDLADEILVLNVNGYIGCSTAREIVYAAHKGKHIRSCLLRVQGMVMLSGYAHPLYQEALADWECRTMTLACSSAVRAYAHQENVSPDTLRRQECIWRNPACVQRGMSLFHALQALAQDQEVEVKT